MSSNRMHLDLRAIPQFEANAQYPPFAKAEPIPAISNMPGVAVFNDGVAAAVARSKEFEAAAAAGVASFKQITRRCGAEYAQNDAQEATNIAKTAATQGNQVQLIELAETNRRLYPNGPNGE